MVGVIVHDITDPYFAEVVRGRRGRCRARRLPGHHLQLRPRRRARELLRPAAALDARRRRVIFAGSGLDDPRSTRSCGKHVAAMREYGAAVVHLSPHALGEPEIGVDNAAGIAAHDRRRWSSWAIGGSRSSPDPPSLYVARERLAGYRRGLADAGIELDERLIVSTGVRPRGRGARRRQLLAGEAPFTADLLRPTICWRWVPAQRLAELGIRRAGRGLRRRLRRHR